jgi:hypothetical protein
MFRRASLRAYDIPVTTEMRRVTAPSPVSLSRDPALIPVETSVHDVVTRASIAALSHVTRVNSALLRLLEL